MGSLTQQTTNFLEYLEIERNASLRTVTNYQHYLKRFLDFAKITTPSAITLPLVKKYRLFLNRYHDAKGHPLKKQTQNYHVIALRAFLKYLAKQDVATLAPDKVELAKTSERQVEFLNDEELEKIFSVPKVNTITGLRDRAILETLFSTGTRISELVSLNRPQLNLKRDQLTVRGKGDKLRVVFLSPACRKWLIFYLQKRKDHHPAVFIRHDHAPAANTATPKAEKSKESKATNALAKGQDNSREDYRLTPRSIQRLVKSYAAQAGINKKITPHIIRHSFATDLLMNGADIRSVQSMLGHASITTTQIYTHITNQQLRDVHQAFHGKRRRRG